VEPARSRAVVQFGRGRAVTTPDLYVADQMMNLISGPARFGDWGDIAEPVAGVRRCRTLMKGFLDQFDAGRQPGIGPGRERSGADPGHPVRRVILIPFAGVPAAGSWVTVEAASAFVRHLARQQISASMAAGKPSVGHLI
jgi:hypothetical protein